MTMSRVRIALLCLEFAVCVSAVVLFGLAYPDRFRTTLWEYGGLEGWNSNPKSRIYFYANHEEPPEIPLIWSQRLADSNLAIGVLSLVVFIVQALTLRLGYLPCYARVLYDMLLFSLWTVSLVGQNSGDFSDPEHASEHPWYLTRGCSSVQEAGYCQVAQGSFAVSIIAATFYGSRLLTEVLEKTYSRGKRQAAQSNCFDEKEYCDDEEPDMEKMLQVGEDWHRAALSPILAFFPSSPQRQV